LRFFASPDRPQGGTLRLILLFFLVFVLLFWATSFVLYFQRMSLSPASVIDYYLGAADVEFGRPARPLGSMAETAHFHLFAMGMLVMTLTHLLVFLPLREGVKQALVAVTFAAAMLDEGAGWLVRFVHPGFAWAKVAGFLLLQASLGGLTLALLAGVARRPGRPRAGDRPCPVSAGATAPRPPSRQEDSPGAS
jgi:hypothetical protein